MTFVPVRVTNVLLPERRRAGKVVGMTAVERLARFAVNASFEELSETAREQLADELRRAVGDLMRAERRLRSRDPGRGDGLSYAQVRALLLLEDSEEATAGQIAKAADLTPASVTATARPGTSYSFRSGR